MGSEISSSCKRSLFEWTVPVCRFDGHRNTKSPEFTYKGKKFYLELYWSNSKTKYAMDMIGECAEAMPDEVTVHVEFGDVTLPYNDKASRDQEHHRRSVPSLPLSSSWWRDTDRMCKVVTIWQIEESQIWKALGGNAGQYIFLVNFVSDEEELTVPVPSAGLTVRGEEKSVQTSPYMNALSCLESLSEDLSKLLEHGSEPDVVLTCGDLKVEAHRNILCARSEVFAAMLNSDMAEKRTSTVDIRDMNQEAFGHFVRYLYSGKLQDLTVDIAKGVYEAADKYAIKALMKRCASCLLENLDPENAFEMLKLADAHNEADFKERVMGYILEKEIQRKQQDRWLAFSKCQPLLALEMANRIFEYHAGK